MKRFLRLLLTGSVFWFSSPIPGWAQQPEEFRTRKLYDMACKLIQEEEIPVVRPGVYDGSSLCSGKKIVVKKDIFGRIGTIGMQLFKPEIKNRFSSPIYDFMERYLLEVLLEGEGEGILAKLKEDKVKLIMGGSIYGETPWSLNSYLLHVRDSDDFMIRCDERGYTAGWDTPRGTLIFSFPKQYELIYGCDKQEMEVGFMEELARVPDHKMRWDTLPVDYLLLSGKKGCYVRQGGVYMVPEIRSDTYYKGIDGSKASLFFEKGMPGESLANLFLEGFCNSNQKITLKIEHKRYGNETVLIDVDLQKWVEYCKLSECKLYVGIEEMDGKHIRGSVIAENVDLGYNHLMYFECSADIFDRLRPEIHAKLYTYVPTHNVKNLFNENK